SPCNSVQHSYSLIILLLCTRSRSLFFFFNHPATTEIYTLSLHDALPISPRTRARRRSRSMVRSPCRGFRRRFARAESTAGRAHRSEEHTSELQSPYDLVCRLLLEKKKKNKKDNQRNNNKQKKLINNISQT